MEIYMRIITILGPSIFIFFGFKGVFQKKTISLFHFKGSSFLRDFKYAYTGKNAVVFGIIYLIIGTLLAVVLWNIDITTFL